MWTPGLTLLDERVCLPPLGDGKEGAGEPEGFHPLRDVPRSAGGRQGVFEEPTPPGSGGRRGGVEEVPPPDPLVNESGRGVSKPGPSLAENTRRRETPRGGRSARLKEMIDREEGSDPGTGSERGSHSSYAEV